jgi:hypothetical protein
MFLGETAQGITLSKLKRITIAFFRQFNKLMGLPLFPSASKKLSLGAEISFGPPLP